MPRHPAASVDAGLARWHVLLAHTLPFLPLCMPILTAQLSALQIIEWHLKGEEDERPQAFDVQQRVYVAIAPSQFMAFTPDEISSGPL